MQTVSSYGVELRKQNIPIRQTLGIYRSAVSYLTEIYEQVWEELEEIPDEFETAYSIAESIVRGIDPNELEYAEKRKLEGKIGRRLAGRGFSMDTIHKVVSRILY